MEQSTGQNTGETLNRTVQIKNIRGLHARASAKFVRLAETFDAQIWVSRADSDPPERVCGTSIMGLMMLAAAPGSEITIETQGLGAEQALDALADLVDQGFQET